MNIEDVLNDLDKRKYVLESIQEAVGVSLEVISKQQEIKNIVGVLKEDYEIPTAQANAVINAIVKENLEEQLDKLHMVERVVGLVKGE